MKQAPKLAQARAYWMLARKADNAGNYREGERYRKVAESKYREYQRQKAFTARLKEQAARRREKR